MAHELLAQCLADIASGSLVASPEEKRALLTGAAEHLEIVQALALQQGQDELSAFGALVAGEEISPHAQLVGALVKLQNRAS